ncbi:hypothetical protein F4813DRAFT_388004 [Daldinia decipiens]|uniref:uncharacterized protein n=1 Tax=Daldinia decipiens TaxID=326647 RepID=UPI0020C243C3|nr:uncharacterized protein F4813DRAFT_388004 [Daldinia decipiens]KAI1659295.1 hypothetical protein F4813DRAFT_388004 [Daldinia decipiens]
MPVRIPRANTTELATFGVAGIASFAPFYFMLPGAEERLASQTARWAPRWERNISYFASPAQRIAQRVEPRVERTVKRIDNRLPLERVAKNVDRRIKYGIDKMDKMSNHVAK